MKRKHPDEVQDSHVKGKDVGGLSDDHFENSLLGLLGEGKMCEEDVRIDREYKRVKIAELTSKGEVDKKRIESKRRSRWSALTKLQFSPCSSWNCA